MQRFKVLWGMVTAKRPKASGMRSFFFGLTILLASAAQATVTTSTKSITFVPVVPTTVFTITYPFVAGDHLTVTKTVVATSTGTVLTNGQHYSVNTPIGSVNGYVTLFASITATHTLTVERVVPLTQTTSFKTQGSFSAARHEDALDKLTMIAQQLNAAAGTDGTAAVDTHVGQSDPHVQYVVEAGRAGGQNVRGGTAAGETLQLGSTAHATKGKILFGSSAYDEVNNRLGIGNDSPTVELEVTGDVLVEGGNIVTNGSVEGAASNSQLTLKSFTSDESSILIYGSTHATFADDINLYADVFTFSDETDSDVYATLDATELALGSGLDLTLTLGHIYTTTTDASVAVYGGTTATPGGYVETYGSTHATFPNMVALRADILILGDETGVNDYALITEDEFIYPGRFKRLRRSTRGSGIADTATIDNCNAVDFIVIANTVLQLPDIDSTFLGCEITLVNTVGAAKEMSLSPDASDEIKGSCTGDAANPPAANIVFGGVVNKDIINTGATANEGDYVIVVADTGSTWWVIGCVGIWADQP